MESESKTLFYRAFFRQSLSLFSQLDALVEGIVKLSTLLPKAMFGIFFSNAALHLFFHISQVISTQKVNCSDLASSAHIEESVNEGDIASCGGWMNEVLNAGGWEVDVSSICLSGRRQTWYPVIILDGDIGASTNSPDGVFFNKI
ncbi:hypothetical protein IFM89_034085 [Coptis chinensis]|uniref:Uncharacterized protein n=1 Tax=Coptis chinensis TaxID=261450 RepID=A0A835I7L6_9MAGN|nr:hypothetical protein IFM89_034085 [Coptis chinensis]